MNRGSFVSAAVAPALLLTLAWTGRADHPAEPDNGYRPRIAEASDEGTRAISSFKVPPGLKVELFAAEPLLANPVAFAVDEQNRFYVAETFRHHAGVTDARQHMYWLDDDLASRSVEDRVAMYKKHMGEGAASYGVEHDRLRLVTDTDGDGVADKATVFADGFSELAAGIGAGVVARGGNVYYTCIPDLWLLRDEDKDGRAEFRRSLQRGYGVHVGFLGHDLHGLRFGPDGKLYFSIGDRGTNVTTADARVFVPDTGAVFRCNPDGSSLEVFATGLRNPQELAFNEFGDLLTVDNNSDAGDRARLVNLVEGGDSGWRIGYQFIESPNSRGPWEAEKLWYLEPENTAKYLLPPLAHLSDGPSGLTYHPGVTRLPDRYRHHFFLADFRGAAGTSGIRTFAVEPNGASFKLTDPGQFVWGLEATDVDFGNDGAIYISDWVEGWNKTGKGRIYKVLDPTKADDPRAAAVKTILAEGMADRTLPAIASLLNHDDQRVRQAAQFELVGRAATPTLVEAARRGEGLARLHAVWGLGMLGDAAPDAATTLVALLDDNDTEVRAQAAKTLGRLPGAAATGAGPLNARLADDSPRVRLFAAISLGKWGAAEPTKVQALLAENGDRDAYLRHAGAVALAGLGDAAKVGPLVADSSTAVRLGALLALRRLGSPEVARFLSDANPTLVVEAARAINDVPIDGALPRLATLEVEAGQPEALTRRILNANIRLGRPEDAARLAALAARNDLPGRVRAEALDALALWAQPPGRDRVIGLWRPLPARPAEDAARAVGPVVADLLNDGPEAVRRAAARAADRLALQSAAPALATLVADAKRTADTRVAALLALAGLDAPQLEEAVRIALNESNPSLRGEGLRLLARLKPDEAIPTLRQVLDEGKTPERQIALEVLGQIDRPEAGTLLAGWLDRLRAGDLPPELRLDVLEAAESSPTAAVRPALEAYSASLPKDDPLAGYRVALAGGDASRGGKVFREKTEAQCVRCHKFDGNGGEVGPELTGIGKRQPRDYILQSIVDPNKQIAEGFESVVVATADGQVLAGVLKGEDADALRLMTPEGKPIAVPKADIEERKRGASAMPEDTIKHLTRRELRDLVEFLAGSK